MTAPAETNDGVFIPTGHPVRRVLTILALVVVLLAVAWAGGLVTPRLTVNGGSGSHDVISGIGTLTISVDNPALADLEIQRAELIAEGVVTTGADLAGVPLEDGPTLAARHNQDLHVHYRVVGCPYVASPHEWKVALTARTAIGLTRTITVPAWFASPACTPMSPP